MTSMTVKEFALELKLPVKTLLAQLRAAGGRHPPGGRGRPDDRSGSRSHDRDRREENPCDPVDHLHGAVEAVRAVMGAGGESREADDSDGGGECEKSVVHD